MADGAIVADVGVRVGHYSEVLLFWRANAHVWPVDEVEPTMHPAQVVQGGIPVQQRMWWANGEEIPCCPH